MKKIWFDNKTGEFNWALVAVIAFAAMFTYSVFTANVIIPEKTQEELQESFQNNRIGHIDKN